VNDSNTRRVNSSLKREDKSAGLACFLLLGFGGVVFGMISTSKQEDLSGGYGFLGVILFFFLTSLGRWIYLFKRDRKYGKVEFVVDGKYGQVGGIAGGLVELLPRLGDNELVEVKLSCVEAKVRTTRNSNSGSSNTVIEKILWQEAYCVKPVMSPLHPFKLAMPVYFKLPIDAQPTQGTRRKGVFWRLELKCDRPGIDFGEMFYVDIKTGDKHWQPSGIMDSIVIEKYDVKETAYNTGHSCSIEDDGYGNRKYHFKKKRTTFGFMFFLAFVAGSTCMLYLVAQEGFRSFENSNNKIQLIALIQPLLMYAAVIYFWFRYLFGKNKFQIGGEQAVLYSGLFAWRKRRFSYSDVDVLEVVNDRDNQRTLFYKLQLKTVNNKQYNIVRKLDKNTANALLADISEFQTS